MNNLELQIGGPVDSIDRIYIEREADQELTDLLKRSEYVNIITSRQMGKTSLVFRVITTLEKDGILCVFFDLSLIRGEKESRSYFKSITHDISRDLNFEIDNDQFWNERAELSASQSLADFFIKLIGSIKSPIIIFLDETDATLDLDFSDDLFLSIRSLYTKRPREPELKRLTFCLVGVASPSEFVKSNRTTPYNIGKTIWLDDFDVDKDDLSKLILILNKDPKIAKLLLSRILYWTSGHPYLTALVCSSINDLGIKTQVGVDEYIEQAFVTLEVVRDNPFFESILRFIDHRFDHSAGTLEIFKKVLYGKPVKDKSNDIRFTHLKLSGLVKRNEKGNLVIRNNLYQKLFDKDWAKQIENTSSRTIKRVKYRNKLFIGSTFLIATLSILIGFSDITKIFQKPIVKLTCDKNLVELGETITCNSFSSQFETLEWDFGNGTNAINIEQAEIEYDKPGTYSVTLEAITNGFNGKSSSAFTEIIVKDFVKIEPPIYLNFFALSKLEKQEKKQIFKVEQRSRASKRLFGTISKKTFTRRFKAEEGYLINNAKVIVKTSRLASLLGSVEISEDKKFAVIRYDVGSSSITDGRSGLFLADLELTLISEEKTNKKLVGELKVDKQREYLIDTIVWDSIDELQIEDINGNIIGKSNGNSDFRIKDKNLILKINKINKDKTTIFVSGVQAFRKDYTYRKKGLFNVETDWKNNWFNYLTIYKDFVQLQTDKGFNILNSPDRSDIFEKKNEGFIEIAGYIRTNNGVFYITKYSYEKRDKPGYPKFISPIP